MKHLYSSVVDVQKQEMTVVSGRSRLAWVNVEGLTDMPCRLDLQFLRPGKDVPPAIQAGVIPDREGIMFCDHSASLRAGMRVVTKPDHYGKEVVKGTFEIKEIPGEALDYSDVHHIEVKVSETTQEKSLMPNIPGNLAPPPAPEPEPEP